MRVHDDVGDGVVRALVRRLAPAEHRAQRPDGVVGPRAAVLERDAQQPELGFEVANAHAEVEPPTADLVQRAVALGDVEGMVIAEHQHRGRKPDPARVSGEITERGERVPVPRPGQAGSRGRDGDVLATGQVVVAEPVGSLGDAAHLIDAAIALPLGMLARDQGQAGVSRPNFVMSIVRLTGSW